jgi:creatinine amidohydrolase
MEAIPEEPGVPLQRMRGLPATYSELGWYADYPEHYAGDARPATAEKGVKLRGLMVDALAEYVAAVKRDEVFPALRRQFDERMNALGR